MDSFFVFLKKSLVATIFMMFAVVATYIPQDWNKVELAYAGGATGGSTEPTQILNNIELVGVNISSALSAGFDAITSFATNSDWIKNFSLDGIAWNIAKAVISSMVSSLIQWINSGFKGSPMFVQDLGGFLRNAADAAIGEYIEELGGPLSFLCDPFKLDIQVAVSLEYQQVQVNRQPAPTCTLSGILENIESFTTGTQGSFANGGWDAWFEIATNPTMYTPYGAEMAAKNQAYVRILNTKGEEAAKLDWGAGFLSGEICNIVQGNGTSKEECFISKPGKVIQEALSFNLDSGRQSLITADEFNEVVAALMGQLAQTAFTGAAGLLGLSSGTGYTYSGYSGGSYLNNMVASSSESGSLGKSSMEEARDIQEAYASLASNAYDLLDDHSKDPTVPSKDQDLAEDYAKDALNISTTAAINVVTIDGLIRSFDSAQNQTEEGDVLAQFATLSLYTESQMDSSEQVWEDLLGKQIPH